MNIKEYLKQNYISICVNDSVNDEDWDKYTCICKKCKTSREVDEMVMFQDYYKICLPIIRKDFANINNVEINKTIK